MWTHFPVVTCQCLTAPPAPIKISNIKLQSPDKGRKERKEKKTERKKEKRINILAERRIFLVVTYWVLGLNLKHVTGRLSGVAFLLSNFILLSSFFFHIFLLLLLLLLPLLWWNNNIKDTRWKVSFPLLVLKTRMPPSPPPATTNWLSGENLIL